MSSPLGRVPDGRPQSGGSACTDFHGSTLVNARQVTRPQTGASETTTRHDLARAGTSRVLIVTFRHKVCHVAFAQNVAITRSPSSKLTGIDVVVNRLCRDAQCVGSLGNRHAFVPLCSVECAWHISPERGSVTPCRADSDGCAAFCTRLRRARPMPSHGCPCAKGCRAEARREIREPFARFGIRLELERSDTTLLKCASNVGGGQRLQCDFGQRVGLGGHGYRASAEDCGRMT